MLKSWSVTQKTVALSSGEAELTAMTKAACELLGVLQMLADFTAKGQPELQGIMFADSSAALGVVSRRKWQIAACQGGKFMAAGET